MVSYTAPQDAGSATSLARARVVSSLAFWALVFAVALATTIAFQWMGRAYRAEIGTVLSDAGSHYLNGLIVKRFFENDDWRHPLAFAQAFYLKYPKVSIGHWPPAFYIFEAAWMTIASESKAAAMVLSALMTAGLATLTGAVAARYLGRVAGLAAAVVLVLMPEIRDVSLELMLDVPIALLSLAAANAYARYLHRNQSCRCLRRPRCCPCLGRRSGS